MTSRFRIACMMATEPNPTANDVACDTKCPAFAASARRAASSTGSSVSGISTCWWPGELRRPPE
eukprot:scaffold4326_cov60-Phaeocystis_antarctica.AAC.2